jgi:hypothetical protein
MSEPKAKWTEVADDELMKWFLSNYTVTLRTEDTVIKQVVSKQASLHFCVEYKKMNSEGIRRLLNLAGTSVSIQSFVAMQDAKSASWVGLTAAVPPEMESRKRGAAAADQDQGTRPVRTARVGAGSSTHEVHSHRAEPTN